MIEAFISYLISAGPIGLFFAAILANASIVFPIPIDVALIPISTIDFFGLGVLTPLILGIIVGTGASIGELTGYLLGRGGGNVLKRFAKLQADKIISFEEKIRKKGFVFILIFAFFPLGFDFVGIAAGLIRYPVKKFWFACFLGKVPRYILISYAGYFALPFLIHFFGVI